MSGSFDADWVQVGVRIRRKSFVGTYSSLLRDGKKKALREFLHPAGQGKMVSLFFDVNRFRELEFQRRLRGNSDIAVPREASATGSGCSAD